MPPAWGPPSPLGTAGGGRGTGSPRIGWPAGRCQGRPSLLRLPLGPTTFLLPHGGASNSMGCPRGSRGARRSRGWGAAGRREGGGGDSEVPLELRAHQEGVRCLHGPSGGSVGLVFAAAGLDKGKGRVDHPECNPVRFAKKKFIPHQNYSGLYTATVRFGPPNRCSKGASNLPGRCFRCWFVNRRRRRRGIPSPKS